MKDGCIAILDIGKTMAKLSLWSAEARLLARYTRPNRKCMAQAGYPALDVAGIEGWVRTTLANAALTPLIAAIVPIAHGAAAAMLRAGALAAAPVDYEAAPPKHVSQAYDMLRAPFAETGSPALPDGLNLGRQLYWMHQLRPDLDQATIVPWAQYWDWCFSGVAASEVSSLGCHTDLWSPLKGDFSPLARSLGGAERFGPLRHAGEVLGTVTSDWAETCGLPRDCQVLCGLHDSNAALLAIRGYKELCGHSCTVLSTGTWFVAMHSSVQGGQTDVSGLSEERDCLVNVDVFGQAVPSARFMGGRECDLIEQAAGDRTDIVTHRADLAAAAEKLVAVGSMALPGFAPHVGPYPLSPGRWIGRPEDPIARRAAASLYLALMAHASLTLIGSSERIVIEGRFADDAVFTGALTALRQDQVIYTTNAHDCVPFGALRLVNPALQPQALLTRATPLPFDISEYAQKWQQCADAGCKNLAA